MKTYPFLTAYWNHIHRDHGIPERPLPLPADKDEVKLYSIAEGALLDSALTPRQVSEALPEDLYADMPGWEAVEVLLNKLNRELDN